MSAYRERLVAASVGKTDVAAHLAVFAELASTLLADVDPDADQDRLLFESGLDDAEYPRNGPVFTLAFTRQVADGEFGDMRHLTCLASYTPTGELHDAPEAQIWGAAGRHAARWRELVEQSPAYQAARKHEPIEVRLEAGLI